MGLSRMLVCAAGGRRLLGRDASIFKATEDVDRRTLVDGLTVQSSKPVDEPSPGDELDTVDRRSLRHGALVSAPQNDHRGHAEWIHLCATGTASTALE